MKTVTEALPRRETGLAEEDFQQFMHVTTSGVFSLLLDEPMPLTLSTEERVAHFWKNARYHLVNTAYARMIGAASPEEIQGRWAREFFGEEPFAEDFLLETVSSFDPSARPFTSILGGKTRHYMCNVQCIFKDGAIVSFWGSRIDATCFVEREKSLVHRLDRQQDEFSRDIHDLFGHDLFDLSLTGWSLKKKIEKLTPEDLISGAFNPHEVASLAENLSECAQGIMRQVRALASGYGAVGLREGGLQAVLRALCARVEEQGLDTRLLVDARVEQIDQESLMHVFKIIKEAVTNALRHAQASKITICIRQEKTSQRKIMVEITDNGSGLGAAKETGIGIKSMQSRAQLLGGSLVFREAPGGGTLVRVVFPMASAASLIPCSL